MIPIIILAKKKSRRIIRITLLLLLLLRTECGKPCFPYLTEFLALVVRYERTQVLETRVYRLHSPPLVGVGDLPAHPFLVFHVGIYLRRSMAHHDRRKSARRRGIHAFLGRVR